MSIEARIKLPKRISIYPILRKVVLEPKILLDWREARKLHPMVEERLKTIFLKLRADSYPVPEAWGIGSGRADLLLFLRDQRTIHCELFGHPSTVFRDLHNLHMSPADVRLSILIDREADPKVAEAYFRAVPDNRFSWIWASQILDPALESDISLELEKLIVGPDSAVSSSGGGARFWNVPFKRNPFFTGREETLSTIEKRLFNSASTAITQSQAIGGLGGIGKTQTAVEFAYKHRDEYDSVFWIAAETEGTLTDSLKSIAEVFGRSADNLGPKELLTVVREGLLARSRWLLICDNADSPEMLAAVLPVGSHGHILLTSRASSFESISIYDPILLERMTADEARAFLIARSHSTAVDDVDQIAKELGYLPLALEQAGAFMSKTKCSAGDYLKSYRTRGIKLLEEGTPPKTEYPRSVATTWSLNFEVIKESSPASADLLVASAFMNPDFIPLEMIAKGRAVLSENIASALLEVERDPVLLYEILQPLTDFSLIKLDPAGSSFSVHRLIQVTLRRTMDPAIRDQWPPRIIRAAFISFQRLDEQLKAIVFPHCFVQWVSSVGEENWVHDRSKLGLLYNESVRALRRSGKQREFEELLVTTLIEHFRRFD